jgi:hypothetical protein
LKAYPPQVIKQEGDLLVKEFGFPLDVDGLVRKLFLLVRILDLAEDLGHAVKLLPQVLHYQSR